MAICFGLVALAIGGILLRPGASRPDRGGAQRFPSQRARHIAEATQRRNYWRGRLLGNLAVVVGLIALAIGFAPAFR